MIDTDGFLMIEPRRSATEPIITDELTAKVERAWATRRTPATRFRGIHFCACGATSDNANHYVTIDGREYLTNSLCIHYVSCHRSEIPQAELDKIARLP